MGQKGELEACGTGRSPKQSLLSKLQSSNGMSGRTEAIRFAQSELPLPRADRGNRLQICAKPAKLLTIGSPTAVERCFAQNPNSRCGFSTKMCRRVASSGAQRPSRLNSSTEPTLSVKDRCG